MIEKCPCCGSVVHSKETKPKPLTDEVPPWEEGPKHFDGISSLQWAMLLEVMRRDDNGYGCNVR